MKAKIRKLWQAELRSGKIKQARGQLRTKKGMCCLGVLCNLHAQAHPKIAAMQTDPEEYMGEMTFFFGMAWSGMQTKAAKFHQIVKIFHGVA